VIRSVSPTPRRQPPSPREVAALSEQAALREVMSRFATGVTVLTAAGELGHGMTANSFSSVSLDPPMVLCCVSRAARMHETIATTQAFAVSVLSAGQGELAAYFADWRRPRGMAQFDSVEWTPGPHTGSPLLIGSMAWLECRLAATYEGGDHSIFLGEVLASSRGDDDQRALLFFAGGYHHIGGTSTRASA
jgi:flavin reductase (DIM6/NTAB) family NADH-FMN oxidoreductase RutF